LLLEALIKKTGLPKAVVCSGGRWLAEVIGLPSVMAYGTSKLQAIGKAEPLA
jgi:hypothetical protein